jgi:NADH-quinone oxidoreductase subunit M
MDNLLSIVTFLPLVAAAIMALFLKGDDAAAQKNAKWLAMIATSATFLISLFILAQFDPANPGFQMVEEQPWLMGLTYKLGVDGISVLFVMLTTFMMPLVIAASWDVTTRVKEYMVAFLVLETLMLGVFMALDLVLAFLVEASPERSQAADVARLFCARKWASALPALWLAKARALLREAVPGAAA